MLFILKEKSGSNEFYLFQNQQYVIGRKNADIILAQDDSISRKHAVIKIGYQSATLTDFGSKYGTFYNDTKMNANSEQILKNNDFIKFGVFKSIYRFEQVNVTTTGSGLTNEQKSQLKKQIGTIEGSVVSNWNSNCTHLTTQELILTVKVILAIVDDKPIVTLSYWDKYIENYKAKKPPPNVKDFKPPITEMLLSNIDLSPNPKRNSVFANKIFVFNNNKYKRKMSDLIIKVGGNCISWDTEPVPLSVIKNSKNTYLFIYNEEETNTENNLEEVFKYLEEIGERKIPIQEIAMAVVLGSCEKDCNPKFNRLLNVFQGEEPQNSKTSQIVPLAAETPSDDASQYIAPKQELIIPESLEEDLGTFVVPTRSAIKRVQEPIETIPKRIKLAEVPSAKATLKSETLPITVQPSTSKVAKQQNTSNKRKAADQINSNNPFLSFATLKQENSTENLGDNDFLQVVHQPKKTKTNPKAMELSCVSISKVEIETPDNSISLMDDHVPSNTTNMSWISPNSSTNLNTTKPIDPEFEEIFEKFRDSIVIEVVPLKIIIKKRSFNSSQSSQSSDSSGVEPINFKKFKKVQPLRPQSTIISTSVYKQEILSDGEEVDDPDEPNESVRVVKRKETPRFDF